MSVCPDSLPMGSFGAPSTGAWFSCLDYVLIRRSSRNPFLVPPSSGLEDPRGPRHCLWSQHADRTIPRTPLSPSGPSWVTPHHLGGPQGGDPNVGGPRPPLRAPSVAPLDPFLSPRLGTEIDTTSGATFGSTPLRPQSGRGAPEPVNYRVNSMSAISLLGPSGDAPGTLLESQPAHPGALLGPMVGIKF